MLWNLLLDKILLVMIRVIIADDHAVVRTGIKLIFDSTAALTIVDEVDKGNDLLNKIKKNDYDVVILDLCMPGKDGFETLKLIKEEKPGLPVVIFSMNPEDQYAIRMIKAGASAYVNKESPAEELMKAIRTVAQNKKYYTPAQSELMMDYINNENSGKLDPHERLSDREFQVMRLLASGIKKKKIAEDLSVSINTISNHRNNILKKMDLTSNSEITRYAIQHGLIE